MIVLVEANAFIKTTRIGLQNWPVRYQRNTLHVAGQPAAQVHRYDRYKGPTPPHAARLLRRDRRRLCKTTVGDNCSRRALRPSLLKPPIR